jgi:cytidyltransferase-like protein
MRLAAHIDYVLCSRLLLRVLLCLQLAKQQGDFLLVGLHTDEDVEARRGPHTPIMNVHERALSVLACKYVDEVRWDIRVSCCRLQLLCALIAALPLL